MIIDTKDKTKKEISTILNHQMGGWLLESHVWSLPDENGIQECYMCGRNYHGGVVKSNFPLCRKNPAILKLLKKYREFLERKNVEKVQAQLLELKKEIAKEDMEDIFSEEDNTWHSSMQKKS